MECTTRPHAPSHRQGITMKHLWRIPYYIWTLITTTLCIWPLVMSLIQDLDIFTYFLISRALSRTSLSHSDFVIGPCPNKMQDLKLGLNSSCITSIVSCATCRIIASTYSRVLAPSNLVRKREIVVWCRVLRQVLGQGGPLDAAVTLISSINFPTM